VTHNLQQAARVSQQTAFMFLGELIEYAPTEQNFREPEAGTHQGLRDGRFG